LFLVPDLATLNLSVEDPGKAAIGIQDCPMDLSVQSHQFGHYGLASKSCSDREMITLATFYGHGLDDQVEEGGDLGPLLGKQIVTAQFQFRHRHQ
jgi:hypothetical protein